MEKLKVSLLFLVIYFTVVLLSCMVYCLATRRFYLVSGKIKDILEIIKYVGRYWFDVFCIISYGLMLAAEAVIQFFWIVGVIVIDSGRKIVYFAQATFEIISLIIRWSKKRHSAKKLAFQHGKPEVLDSKVSDYTSERGFIA